MSDVCMKLSAVAKSAKRQDYLVMVDAIDEITRLREALARIEGGGTSCISSDPTINCSKVASAAMNGGQYEQGHNPR